MDILPKSDRNIYKMAVRKKLRELLKTMSY